MLLEEAALAGLNGLQVVRRVETAIDQGLVGQGLEVFGGLQLPRIVRQETKMEIRGQQELAAGVLAGTIQDEKDVFARNRADEAGEFAQRDLEGRERDSGWDQEEGTPRVGMDHHGRTLAAPNRAASPGR